MGFRVSGSGFEGLHRVQGFGFRISRLAFRASGFKD